MSLGQNIIDFIQKRREHNNLKIKGPLGDFYRAGGNQLLLDVNIDSNQMVLDIGGYKGEWTSHIFLKYGCKSIIYEPNQSFAEICKNKFKYNQSIQVVCTGVGGSNRKANFSNAQDGTSEFLNNETDSFEAEITDIAEILAGIATEIGCMKINIEGGEYELVERLLTTGKIELVNNLLIQFHRQPADYQTRYNSIIEALKKTHQCVWSFNMVWEYWKKN
ncbi:MAG: FkbM family methyltransferase [Bacteroidota bacterium]